MDKKVFDFKWSLKSILTWMNLFGIRVNGSEKLSILLKIFIVLQGFAILACILFVHNISIKSELEGCAFFIGLIESEMKNEMLRSIIYDAFLNFLFTIGPHIILFLFSSIGTLKKLLENLIEIEGKLSLNGTFYRKVRRQCYIGLSLLFLVRNKLIN